jgi:hypothetical protein
LETCDPTGRLNLRNELGTIKVIANKGLSYSRATSNVTTWDVWSNYCRSVHCNPYLPNLPDPIPALQVFADRYCLGIIAPHGAKVRSRTVEGALRAVGQAFASLGRPDPRLQPSGKLDIRLTRQLQAYKKADPPPTRVKPVPIPVITHAATTCYQVNLPKTNAIADMLLLGFFFLLRPGEYAFTNNPDSSPFRFCDVHLLIHTRRINHYTCTEAELATVTHVALEFTTQKKGVQGELIGLGRSGHLHWCPVQALTNRIRHLRLHNADPTTPIYSYHTGHERNAIDTTTLTTHLCSAAVAVGAASGITAADISICSLRSSGAMALLCAKVDPDKIRLMGRWQSDEMLRYLHVQAFPITATFASQMLQHGSFALLPNNRLPLVG